MQVVDKVANAIFELEQCQLTLEEIIKTNVLDAIFDEITLRFIALEVNKRFRKFKAKKGSELSQEQLELYKIAIEFKVALEHLLRAILGHYGVSGGRQIDYHGLANRVAKIVRKNRPQEWARKISGELESWKIRLKVDEKIAKVVALAIAKLAFKYYYT